MQYLHRFHIPDFPEQFFLCKHAFGFSARKVSRSNSLVVNVFSSPFTHTRRAVLSILKPRISMISFSVHWNRSDAYIVPDVLLLCYQFTWTEWFCHIIICAKSQTTDLINIIFLCRYHNDRSIFLPVVPDGRYQSHPLPEASDPE